MPPTRVRARLGLLAAVVVFACGPRPAPAALFSSRAPPTSPDYGGVLGGDAKRGIAFDDLPGFTRSVYARDHALIAPESRTWAPLAGWANASAAVLASKGSGAAFTMLLADVGAGGALAAPVGGKERGERLVFVLDGVARVEVVGPCAADVARTKGAAPGAGGAAGDPPATTLSLGSDGFVYLPPGCAHTVSSDAGAGMLMYERLRAGGGPSAGRRPRAVAGQAASALPAQDPGGGEVFGLRKLLPAAPEYDFNVHVMDFQPGQALKTKEVHYNQHGLLMLEGGGVYRLGDAWYSVKAGDAIWMAPFCVQWFGALGEGRARYIIYKDTVVDPLLS